MHVCRAPVSTLKAAFMLPPPALGAIPSVRACVRLPTFVRLQQLVVELHHLLALAELQQALAQVESHRQANLLQRLPVLAVLLHLQGAV